MTKENTSVREFSQILGTIVAAHPAILLAPIHYKHLEIAKTLHLRRGFSYDWRHCSLLKFVSVMYLEYPKYNYRFPDDCRSDMGRMNCMRR